MRGTLNYIWQCYFSCTARQHRKVWNFSLWRFWTLIREKDQNWVFCRKVIVALRWNVGFPFISPFYVSKKGSSTLTFQVSQKYIFLKNAYSGISPGYAWRGYCKLFLCFLYSTWECELEGLHPFELPVLWAGLGRTRSSDVWSGCCLHTRASWQKEVIASTQIPLWGWDQRHKPERKSFIITGTKPSWHSSLVHTV